MKICMFCDRMRSEKYMQEAVFRGSSRAFDISAGVWACAGRQTCKNARRVCPRCNHRRSNHTLQARWFEGRTDVVACTFNMGMGDPCGCEYYEKEVR